MKRLSLNFLFFAIFAAVIAAAVGIYLDPAAGVITAMASAIPTQGSTLKISVPGSPSQLLAVGNLTSFNLNCSAPVIDATNLDSLAKEVLTGVPEWTFSGTINLDPDNARHQEMMAAIGNRTLIEAQLQLTDPTPSKFSFQGYVNSWNPSGGLNDKVTLSFSIAINGGVVQS